MDKPKKSRRLKSTIGRGTETPRGKLIGNDYYERSNAYSARPRPISSARKDKMSAKAKPKKFSMATANPYKRPAVNPYKVQKSVRSL